MWLADAAMCHLARGAFHVLGGLPLVRSAPCGALGTAWCGWCCSPTVLDQVMTTRHGLASLNSAAAHTAAAMDSCDLSTRWPGSWTTILVGNCCQGHSTWASGSFNQGHSTHPCGGAPWQWCTRGKQKCT
jgi:hypothetical protein